MHENELNGEHNICTIIKISASLSVAENMGDAETETKMRFTWVGRPK